MENDDIAVLTNTLGGLTISKDFQVTPKMMLELLQSMQSLDVSLNVSEVVERLSKFSLKGSINQQAHGSDVTKSNSAAAVNSTPAAPENPMVGSPAFTFTSPAGLKFKRNEQVFKHPNSFDETSAPFSVHPPPPPSFAEPDVGNNKTDQNSFVGNDTFFSPTKDFSSGRENINPANVTARKLSAKKSGKTKLDRSKSKKPLEPGNGHSNQNSDGSASNGGLGDIFWGAKPDSFDNISFSTQENLFGDMNTLLNPSTNSNPRSYNSQSNPFMSPSHSSSTNNEAKLDITETSNYRDFIGSVFGTSVESSSSQEPQKSFGGSLDASSAGSTFRRVYTRDSNGIDGNSMDTDSDVEILNPDSSFSRNLGAPSLPKDNLAQMQNPGLPFSPLPGKKSENSLPFKAAADFLSPTPSSLFSSEVKQPDSFSSAPQPPNLFSPGSALKSSKLRTPGKKQTRSHMKAAANPIVTPSTGGPTPQRTKPASEWNADTTNPFQVPKFEVPESNVQWTSSGINVGGGDAAPLWWGQPSTAPELQSFVSSKNTTEGITEIVISDDDSDVDDDGNENQTGTRDAEFYRTIDLTNDTGSIIDLQNDEEDEKEANEEDSPRGSFSAEFDLRKSTSDNEDDDNDDQDSIILDDASAGSAFDTKNVDTAGKSSKAPTFNFSLNPYGNKIEIYNNC